MTTEVVTDYTAMRFYWDVAQGGITILTVLYVFITSRSQVNTDRINRFEDDADDRFKKLTERVTRVEERVEMGPTHDDLKDIFSRLNGQSRDLSKLMGKFDAHGEMLQRINDFLINQGNK